MNEKTYEQLVQRFRLEIRQINAEFNARLLALENRMAEMEDERTYERNQFLHILNNLDTQEWEAVQDED